MKDRHAFLIAGAILATSHNPYAPLLMGIASIFFVLQIIYGLLGHDDR